MNLVLQIFDNMKKPIVLGGDFNLFLDSVLKAEGGSPVLKKSVSKLIKNLKKIQLM